MKTVRLLFLLCWALAAVTGAEAAPKNFRCTASVPCVPALNANTPEAAPPTTLTGAAIVAADQITAEALEKSNEAAAGWQAFVEEWLLNRKKMWVWMFLLLLLLARL